MSLGLNPPFSTVYREVRHDAELDGRDATVGSRVLVSLCDANSDVGSEPLGMSLFDDPKFRLKCLENIRVRSIQVQHFRCSIFVVMVSCSPNSSLRYG